MLQVIYISTVMARCGDNDLSHILSVSRTNNARDDITGLLFFNRKRFLQALEGPEARIERTIARIAADDRHGGLVVLSRRVIETREFGSWAMASLGHDDAAARAAIARVDVLTAEASPNVRAQFTSYARLQAA